VWKTPPDARAAKGSLEMRGSKTERMNPLSAAESVSLLDHLVILMKIDGLTCPSRYLADSQSVGHELRAARRIGTALWDQKDRLWDLRAGAAGQGAGGSGRRSPNGSRHRAGVSTRLYRRLRLAQSTGPYYTARSSKTAKTPTPLPPTYCRERSQIEAKRACREKQRSPLESVNG
jgi:hypothetical protein